MPTGLAGLPPPAKPARYLICFSYSMVCGAA